jgi:DNA/RNA non-specific endonuclease
MAGTSNPSRSNAANTTEELFAQVSRDGFSWRPTFNFQTPPPGRGTMKVGDQWYRSMDNGHAIVLAPIDDPRFSPAEHAQQREAVRRAIFDANHTLGGVAAGLATLVGASPGARDIARGVGAAVDAALMLGTGARPPRLGEAKPQLAPPTQERPSIRYGQTNSMGQATGVNATIVAPMLGTGSKANRRNQPPGWSGNGNKYNESRGHLLANNLGGAGNRKENIVTLTQTPSNSPDMRTFEHSVARRVKNGEVVEYFATPLYGDAPAPGAVLLTAHGAIGGSTAKVIGNPAGRR